MKVVFTASAQFVY